MTFFFHPPPPPPLQSNQPAPRPSNYLSLCVEGITYFYDKNDITIPNTMLYTGENWAKEDIENFINIADQIRYKDISPQTGIFLDIGGNMGTTSVYCKLKMKPRFQFIAFEPLIESANIFTANAAINGIYADITVENLALSNQYRENAPFRIDHSNLGASGLTFNGEGEHVVITTTLDDYMATHSIAREKVKYIWIDVEGHEPEVLEGASQFYKDFKVPTCLEFNQGYYTTRQTYLKMIELLEKYFEYFVVCSKIDASDAQLRPISEVKLLMEEYSGNACDLILI